MLVKFQRNFYVNPCHSFSHYSNLKPFNTGEINSTHSKTSDELYKTAEDSTSNSASLPKQDNSEVASVDSPELSSRQQTISAGGFGSGSHKSLPTKNDGSLDYDGETSLTES